MFYLIAVPRKVVPTAASTLVTRLVNFKPSEVTKDSVTLTWLVEGNVPFEWIVLQYREPEGGIRELLIPGQDTFIVVQGLLPSQKYEFTVYGLKGNKRSESLSTEVQTGTSNRRPPNEFITTNAKENIKLGSIATRQVFYILTFIWKKNSLFSSISKVCPSVLCGALKAHNFFTTFSIWPVITVYTSH